MKNILIGLTIGLLFNGLIAFASEHIMVNKPQCLLQLGGASTYNTIIYTTKATTPEGVYRLFILQGYQKAGITAVRIK